MDKQLIEQKLESLRHCIGRVQMRVPTDIASLEADEDTQDIIALNLSRSVQLCVDIASHLIACADESAPPTMGESFTSLTRLNAIDAETAERMRKAVGFRNIAAHQYEAISWTIVFAICTEHLVDFKNFAKQISAYAEL